MVWQPVQEKENSEFKPTKLCLKIDLVSYPAHGGVVGKYTQDKQKILRFIWKHIGFFNIFQLSSVFVVK